MDKNYVFTQTPEEIQGILNSVPTIGQQVDGLQQNVGTLNDAVGNLGESVTQLQETKVEKVEGKQLSTEDFTSEDKAKLEALPTNEELQSEYASQTEVDGIDERLEVVEQLAQISVSGGEIGIATPSDFDNPTPEQEAKVPTVGAILGCMDIMPKFESVKPVQGNGIAMGLGELGYFYFERGGISGTGANLSNGNRARSSYVKLPIGTQISVGTVSGFPCSISIHEYNAAGDTVSVVKTGWSQSWKTTTAEWIRITFKFDDSTTHIITDGDLSAIKDAISFYDPMGQKMDFLFENLTVENLYIDASEFVNNQPYINSSRSGVEGTEDMNATTAQRLVLPVYEGAQKVTATLGMVDSTRLAIAFYSNDVISAESFISGVYTQLSPEYTVSADIPQNAKMIVVTNRYASNNNPSCVVSGNIVKSDVEIKDLSESVKVAETMIATLNGNRLEASNFERGNWTEAGKGSSAYRIRTKEKISVKSGDVISISPSDDQFVYFGKYVNDVYSYETIKDKKNVTIAEDCDIVFTVRYYADNAPITANDLNCTIIVFSSQNNIVAALSKSGEDAGGSEYYGKKIILNELMKEKNPYNVAEIGSVLWVSDETPSSVVSNWLVDLQSTAIFGGYIFNWLDHGNCLVMDFTTGAIIGKFDNVTPSAWHNNNAQFSNIYYDPNDEFPLCLVSDAHLRSSGAECAYVRIQRNGNDFTFTVVQNIIVECEYGVNYGTFVADWMTNKLYMYCYEYDLFAREGGVQIHYEFNPTIIVEYELPAFASGSTVTLDNSKILNMAKYPTYRPYAQGGFAVNGKVFIAWRSVKNAQSYTNEEANAAMGYDYENAGKMIAVFAQCSLDLESFIQVGGGAEMEGLCLYDGKMYLTERIGGWTNEGHVTPDKMKIYRISEFTV